MRLKSYYVPSVENAIQQARQELGEDAMLVHSKPTDVLQKHLGEYEVVFACSPGLEKPEPKPATVEDHQPALDQFATDISEIKRQVGRILAQVSSQQSGLDPARAELQQYLVAQGAESSEATRILSELPETFDDSELTSLRSALLKEIRVSKKLDTNGLMAVVGAPASGKTTTILKIAAASLIHGVDPLLLSFDNQRIGAMEQMRCFGDVLGLKVLPVENSRRLRRILDTESSRSLILIDTPGIGSKNIAEAAELADTFAEYEIPVQAVLSAAQKPADADSVMKRLNVFSPSGLIFTHVDETSSYGQLWTLSSKWQFPITRLCTGPEIPEDIEEASSQRIVDLILGPLMKEREVKTKKPTIITRSKVIRADASFTGAGK